MEMMLKKQQVKVLFEFKTDVKQQKQPATPTMRVDQEPLTNIQVVQWTNLVVQVLQGDETLKNVKNAVAGRRVDSDQWIIKGWSSYNF